MAAPTRSFKEQLARASRSRRFLWQLGLIVLICGALAGYGLHQVRPVDSETLAQRVMANALSAKESGQTLLTGGPTGTTAPRLLVLPALRHELANPDITFEHLFAALRPLAVLLDRADLPEFETLVRQRFSSNEAEVSAAFVAAYGETDEASLERLKVLAGGASPRRHANAAAGEVETARRNMREGYRHFLREAELFDHPGARRRAIETLLVLDDLAEIERLRNLPAFKPVFNVELEAHLAIKRMDWPAIFKWLALDLFRYPGPGMLILAVVTALGWGFLLVHLGQLSSLRGGYAALCAAGLVAGFLSLIPTDYLIVWMERTWEFAPGDDVFHVAAYYVGSVGLREELSKLLLFLPLLPFLLRRGDELEALIVASFVGLGFAAGENLDYFAGSEGSAAAARFLTANFFHIGLTGVNGLALYRACAYGGGGWNDFLFVFPMTVLAHGLYDAFIMVDLFEMSDILHMVVYILFSAYYFRRAHALRSSGRMTISLTGAFVFAVSAVAATAIGYQTTVLGPTAAFNLLVPEFIGSGVLLFMFFREFNEALAP